MTQAGPVHSESPGIASESARLRAAARSSLPDRDLLACARRSRTRCRADSEPSRRLSLLSSANRDREEPGEAQVRLRRALGMIASLRRWRRWPRRSATESENLNGFPSPGHDSADRRSDSHGPTARARRLAVTVASLRHGCPPPADMPPHRVRPPTRSRPGMILSDGQSRWQPAAAPGPVNLNEYGSGPAGPGPGPGPDHKSEPPGRAARTRPLTQVPTSLSEPSRWLPACQ